MEGGFKKRHGGRVVALVHRLASDRFGEAAGLGIEGQVQGARLTQGREEELEGRDFASAPAPAVFFCQLLSPVRADKLIQSLEKSVYHKQRDITRGVARRTDCKML